ncbi:unnamed protein product [Rodentolepis nana]|uniref:Uncharacterized protein n=1 Tax=Rodentolepis nana TaxID=102285 RepID=A0A3P7VXM6_RODNA|nr:unnamed protein product [Rodentolepis nana]
MRQSRHSMPVTVCTNSAMPERPDACDCLYEFGYVIDEDGEKRAARNSSLWWEPGQPPVNHSFHKFSEHTCERDGPIVVKVSTLVREMGL